MKVYTKNHSTALNYQEMQLKLKSDYLQVQCKRYVLHVFGR